MDADRLDVEEHLRAASDAILLLVRQVEQLELHKRGVEPGRARFDELAASVRRAAQDLAEFARDEEAWARDAAKARPLPSISASPNPPPLAEILERWRAVERQLNDATPGSPEAARLFEEFTVVRDEYLNAFRTRAGHD